MDAETKEKLSSLEAEIKRLRESLDDALFSIEFFEKQFVKFQVKTEEDIKVERKVMTAVTDKLREWINESADKERNALREFARNHLHHHVELDDYAVRAFGVTHPDIVKTMADCRAIIGSPPKILGESEDEHAFIDRMFDDKDWDGSAKPSK